MILYNVHLYLFLVLQDHKLKHMAELQQSVVTDQDTRHQIQTQILQWEENLERLHCEQFRLRCYMASLQSGELPNPKVSKKKLISFVSVYQMYYTRSSVDLYICIPFIQIRSAVTVYVFIMTVLIGVFCV